MHCIVLFKNIVLKGFKKFILIFYFNQIFHIYYEYVYHLKIGGNWSSKMAWS